MFFVVVVLLAAFVFDMRGFRWLVQLSNASVTHAGTLLHFPAVCEEGRGLVTFCTRNIAKFTWGGRGGGY